MPLTHKCPEAAKPIVQYLDTKPPYDFESEVGWHIALYGAGDVTHVLVKFCPHCGVELPNACGCCGGTGRREGMEEGSGIPFEFRCEICHGSGEEQD